MIDRENASYQSACQMNSESALVNCDDTQYAAVPFATSPSEQDLAEITNDNKKTSFSLCTITKEQKIVLAITSVTNVLSFLTLSIVAPIFPIVADSKGVSNTVSGWIFGIFPLVAFLSSPILGKIMPHVGRKFMYISGLFVTGGCTLIFGQLDQIDAESRTIFVVLCFVTRIMLAIAFTAVENASFVVLFKAFPDSVATVFGIGEIFTGLGFVAGPAIGGFLYKASGLYVVPFAVVSGCAFVSVPIVWICLPPQDDSSDSEEANMSIKDFILHPRSIITSLAIVTSVSALSVLEPILEPYLHKHHLGPDLVGVMFLVISACYSITSPIWGRVSDTLSDARTLLIPGLLLLCIGLLLAGPSPILGFDLSYYETWLSVLSLIILGLGTSMCLVPTYNIYMDVLCDLGYSEDTKASGIVSGLWVSMDALGDFAGPSLGGMLYDHIGFQWLLTCFACLCAFTSILVGIYWLYESKCKRNSNVIQQKTCINDIIETEPLLASASNGAVTTTLQNQL